MRKIGITTTVPAEIIYAAGAVPVDLNNAFIMSEKYAEYIERAERDGFPKSMCAWIKGIYGAVLDLEIDTMIGVIEGDCSNTKVLLEVLEQKGIQMIPFGYPHGAKKSDMHAQLKNMQEALNVSDAQVNEMRKKLGAVRELGNEIDRLTWETNQVSGMDNHVYLINFSDFRGDPENYETLLKEEIEKYKSSEPKPYSVRLGVIGVPPMQGDLYEYIENCDAHVVFNEIQREFMFPRWKESRTLCEQYLDYNYPYDLNRRTNEIQDQIEKRSLDAVIHYTQAFCHKAVEDILIKNTLSVPVLQIEGDKLNVLDARTKLRLEAFIDMVKDRKEMAQ